MIHLLREIHILKQAGKLHTKLIMRTRMLFIIAMILLGIVIFNIVWRDIDIFISLGLGVIGFILGLYIFSEMNVVNWNEEEEVLKSGKMDTVGFIALGLYIVFEIGLRTFLSRYFPATVIPLLLSGICGTILGRAIGTLVEIHRVYQMQSAKKQK